MAQGALRHKLVRDFMVRDVVAVNPKDSVADVLKLLVENKVSAVPVVDGHERCVGVLSATDLLQLGLQFADDLDSLHSSVGLAHELLIEKLEATGFSDQTVAEVMTHLAVTTRPEATVVQAAAAMLRNRVHRLPVTDAHGRLVGLVSSMDIVRAVAELESL